MNDLHSCYEKLGKNATILNQKPKKCSLLFDTGDHADFMRVETKGSNGIISAELMNTLRHDAFCYGNNESFFML